MKHRPVNSRPLFRFGSSFGAHPLSHSLLLSLLLFPPALAEAATAPPLSTAAAFAVLGATTVTNTGLTTVTGDLGVSPGTAVVGFPPGVVSGTIHTTVSSNAGPAQADALVAYTNAALQPCDTDLTGVDLGGLTLVPGVYCFSTSAQLTGTLTLDFLGNSNAVFVFQMGSSLTTAPGSRVEAINGSPSCHQVFWKVGSSATIDAGSVFQGDVLALASITMNTSATSAGSLYALTGAVTLQANQVGTCALPCANDAECVDDGNLCTDEVCAPAAPDADTFGCIHPDNTIPCIDGSFCTVNDACSLGVCAGTPNPCGDGNLCTTDSCDETADVCVHDPNILPCSDGLFCNGIDVCSAGICTHPGDPCAGGGICGASCDEVSDSCFATAATVCRPAAGPCDLAEFCSGAIATCPPDGLVPGGTTCRADAGICDVAEACTGIGPDCPVNGFEPATTPCSTDNNVCTNDGCDGNGLCIHVDNTVSCDDASACNGTDTCFGGICTHAGGTAVCGDGVVNLACGEICDAPGAEICNNGVDDDGDGLADCIDPDCLVTGVVGCDALCQLPPPCVTLQDDPATIYTSSTDPRPIRRGSLTFHGKFLPTTRIDPRLDAFLVTISNATGVIYRAELPALSLVERRKGRYVYRNRDRDSVVASGGIERLYLRSRQVDGAEAYGVRVRAFGDFSGATLPLMTTQIYVGDDVAYLTATWHFRKERWKLYRRDFQ